MRALHLVKTASGATWALRQMKEMVSLGVEVHVALPPNGPLVPDYAAAGVQVHHIDVDFPVRRPWQWPRVRRQFLEAVYQVQPDIIHSHFVGTTLTMRLALGKHHAVPRVFQVPGPLHLEHGFFRQAEVATAGDHDFWVGSCQWTCRRYQKMGIDASRVFLSYYGSDLERVRLHPPGKLRRELGIGPETRIVGMVAFMYAPKRFLGQTRGLKGHEDLIEAVSLSAKHIPDIKCVFVGGAWAGATQYERRVREYAQRICGDQAIFLGTRSDVPELYPDFDVAVHPSHSENVGGACESLLLAVPTIATNVGGFPDIVRPDETGWLVPPHSPGLLAEAIVQSLSDPVRAKAMAERGQERARALFDVRRTAKEMVDIYHKIL